MANFDWWQGTVHGPGMPPETVMADLVRGLGGDVDVVHDSPKNGYVRGAKLVRGPVTFATVWWKGNPGVHVKATGRHARQVGPLLQKMGALPSRIDVCEDWIEPGLSTRLFNTAHEFALANRIKVSHQGDWLRGFGRTLYLGARSSTAQLVIYEKGHQLGVEPDWVRLEVRLYPKARNRDVLGQMLPGECIGVCTWIREYVETCLGWDHLKSLAIGTVWEPSDVERARLALLRQYGKIIRALVAEAGGWDAFGVDFERELEALKHARRENPLLAPRVVESLT